MVVPNELTTRDALGLYVTSVRLNGESVTARAYNIEEGWVEAYVDTCQRCHWVKPERVYGTVEVTIDFDAYEAGKQPREVI
jgi:hypothetical protein